MQLSVLASQRQRTVIAAVRARNCLRAQAVIAHLG